MQYILRQIVNESKMRDKKKIFIINPFGIGDVLFSTPLICNLKHCYLDSHIAFMPGEKTALILENKLNIDEVIPFTLWDFKRYFNAKRRALALTKMIGVVGATVRRRVDRCFDLLLKHRHSLELKLLAARRRIG